MPKLSLNVEELLVDSFDTGSKDQPARSFTQGGWSDDSVCPTPGTYGRCCPP